MAVQTCQMTCLSLFLWQRGIICPFRRLSSLNVHIVDVSHVVCSHYVSSHFHFHHYYTCDCCVLWNIPNHHDGYTCFHLGRSDNIGSMGCGSAAKVDSEGLFEGCCWPHMFSTVTSTSVPGAFSGLCQLCHGSSTDKFLFQSWPPSDSYIMCLVTVIAFVFCFQICMLLPCSSLGAQVLGFATLQPFRVYPW